MAKEAFISKKFNASSVAIIDKADTIIKEYQKQGFVLTLRQLYYQFVARGILENSQQNYKRLGGIVSDGRLAGLLDWSAIEDRTRNAECKDIIIGPRICDKKVGKITEPFTSNEVAWARRLPTGSQVTLVQQ